MADQNQELDRLVKLKSGKEIERIMQETESELIQKSGELRAKGTLGGPEIKLAMDISLKRSDRFPRARYGAFREVYGTAGLLTADGLRTFGKEQADTINADQIVSNLKQRPNLRSVSENVFRGVDGEVYKLKSRFLRDIEIDATNLQLQAAKAPPGIGLATPSNSHYDVFISFASPDAPTAVLISDRFKAHGLTVFFSPKELKGGDHWEGNDYRLITRIDYGLQTVTLKYFLTRTEYDRGSWKKDC